MIYLLLALTLLVVAFLYLRSSGANLDMYGIKYLKPTPLLGNLTEVMKKKRHFLSIVQDLYENFGKQRFTAMYEFTKPTIHINDPELIKKIAVKDFEHFMDRKSVYDPKSEPFFARNLFTLHGQDWKDMRSTLSPAFTSSKMRAMVPFMVEVNEQLIKFLKTKINESQDGFVNIDCQSLTSKYSNDIIASCAFGVKVDSHVEETNDFYTMGKSLTGQSARSMIVMLGYMAVPGLMRKLQIRLLPEKTTRFFSSVVINNMKERDQHQIIRPDMIHLLMEAKKGKLRHEGKDSANAGFATVEESEIGTKTNQRVWSDDDLIAQAVLFYMAGYDTVSTTLSFLLFELALHPEAQDRLYREIEEHGSKNGGKLDYDNIQDLKYLDMVVSEVLRKWPSLGALIRECVKDYNIGRANENATRDYIVRKGEHIAIPVWPVHRSAEYFPDPDKFDPERFSDENKKNIKPFSYMPFGFGPRNCIGSRFALCEVKAMAYQMIQHFELSPCEKTAVPPKLDPTSFHTAIEGGTWVRIRARKI